MDGRHDLEVILRSRTPIIVIETRDEPRILDMLKEISVTGSSEQYMPLFQWTVTDGLQRLDIDLEPQAVNAKPTDVLKHIRAVAVSRRPGAYPVDQGHLYSVSRDSATNCAD
jgi:hypothetical protein